MAVLSSAAATSAGKLFAKRLASAVKATPHEMARGFKSPVTSTVDTIATAAQGLVREAPDSLFGYELSKFGKVAAFGASGIAAVSGASAKRDQNDMGMITGQVKRAVPSYAAYMPQQRMGDISGGATGDLVFSLHNQRGGGHV